MKEKELELTQEGETRERVPSFVTKSISICFPFSSLKWMLCAVNALISSEKVVNNKYPQIGL